MSHKEKILNATPDLMFFGSVVFALLLDAFLPSWWVLQAPFNYIFGLFFIVVGIVCSVLVLVFMVSQGGSTDVVRTSGQLITKKYFSFSRNPLYLAELIVLLGVASLLGSVSAYSAPLVYFFVLNFIVIPYEEVRLRRVFGREYEDYKRSTRRWL